MIFLFIRLVSLILAQCADITEGIFVELLLKRKEMKLNKYQLINDTNVRPLGLEKSDTLEDALKRADQLSKGTSYSAILIHRKDLRRIVLLAHEYRRLLKRKNEKSSS